MNTTKVFIIISMPTYFPLLYIFFVKLTIISKFIWNKKIPRIRKDFLQRPKMLGGMALKNLKCYYSAANLRLVQVWLHSNPLFSLIQLGKLVSLSVLANTPIKSASFCYTRNIIKLKNQFKCLFGLLSSVTAKIIFNPLCWLGNSLGLRLV